MVIAIATTSKNNASQVSSNRPGVQSAAIETISKASVSFTVGALGSGLLIVLVAAVGALSTLARMAVGIWRRAAARRELTYLDDRMLRDIGLCRDEIPSMVSGRIHDFVALFKC